MSPRYTSANQFANMLQKRARELGEFCNRMEQLNLAGKDTARQLVTSARWDLEAAVRVLRQRSVPSGG